MRVFALDFFFSSRRRHTRSDRDWSSDVCSSDLAREDDAHVPGLPGRSDDHERRLPRAARARGREGRRYRDRMGAVLDARADGSQGAGPDGTLRLFQGLEQRVPERLDLPAPELPDTGEPGTIVWRRLGAGDRLEDRAPAQHARVERQLRGGPIANRLEALDPRLERRIARLSWGALHAGELAFRQRECALHAIEQRGSVTW